MTNKNAIPEIRFKGFSDDWEQREFSKQYVKVSEKNDLSFGTDKIISVANMYFKEDTKESSDDYMRTYNVMRLGDIAFEGNKSKNFAHGRFVENTIGDGIVSHVFDVFRPIVDYDLLFWKYIINNEGVMGRIMTRCTKSSTMMTNLVADDFLKEKIAVPSLEEQRQIGSFLNGLDNLITLHQRKLGKITKVKMAMLEKMFPKNGSNVPEIRFKGFTDAWEQRKLSEIYDSIGNAFVGTATPYYVEQGHFYLESNNIKDGQINHNSEVFINDEFYERQKDKWLHAGDMVMVQSGHVGHAAVIPEELDNSAAHALIMFRNPKVKIEPFFLNYQYQTSKAKKKIEGITTGNTIKHILASNMQEFVVDLPDYDEQKQIGSYFCNLDNLITLHQRECEKLQNIKKSMLEKMFPTSKSKEM